MPVQRSDPKVTMLVITTGLVVLHLVFSRPWMLPVAAGAGIIGIFFPRLGMLVEMVWSKLAFALGWVNSRILLGFVFFVILTPIALVRRFWTKDELSLRSKSAGTQWKVRDHTYGPRDLEKPW
jgi:hypothetical protein